MKQYLRQLPFCFTLLLVHSFANADIVTITNEKEFDDNTKNSSALVKFSATWCGACSAVKKPFQELSQEPEFANVKFLEVDVDANPATSKKYNITGMPTFIYLENGNKKELSLGASGKEVIRESLRKNFGNALKAKPASADAKAMADRGAAAQPTSTPAAAAQSTSTPGAWQSIKDGANNVWGTITGWFK